MASHVQHGTCSVAVCCTRGEGNHRTTRAKVRVHACICMMHGPDDRCVHARAHARELVGILAGVRVLRACIAAQRIAWRCMRACMGGRMRASIKRPDYLPSCHASTGRACMSSVCTFHSPPLASINIHGLVQYSDSSHGRRYSGTERGELDQACVIDPCIAVCPASAHTARACMRTS